MSDFIRRKEALHCAEMDSEIYIAINCLPSVNLNNAEHGHWVEYPECLKYENAIVDTDIVCSCCGEVFNAIGNDTERFNYCPHCGAKMDGEQNE